MHHCEETGAIRNGWSYFTTQEAISTQKDYKIFLNLINIPKQYVLEIIKICIVFRHSEVDLNDCGEF